MAYAQKTVPVRARGANPGTGREWEKITGV